MTQTTWLFISLFLFLMTCTIGIKSLSWILPDSATADRLYAQTKTWWWIVLVLCIAFMLGSWGLIIVFYFASFYALREFISLIPTKANDYYALVFAYYIVLPIQYLMIALDWELLFSIFIPVYVSMAIPALALLGNEKELFLERFAKIQWGLMLTVYGLSMLPAMLSLDIPADKGNPLLLVAWFILVIQFSDVFQYLINRYMGKRAFLPNYFHKKTWEGLLAGIGLAGIIGMTLSWLTPFTLYAALFIALGISITASIGRMIMLVIKKTHGVQRWGHMLKTHGGMLDRVDSICFSAPIFYHLANLYWS